MKDKDLIRELENLETPDVDLPGHRQTLRAALLDSDCFRKRTSIGWVRVLAPVAAAVALMVVFGFFNIVQPQIHIAQAREIAATDPGVKALMEEYGLAIADVRLQDGEAFVLLAPGSAILRSEGVVFDEQPAGYLAPTSASSHVLDRLFGWMFPYSADESGLDIAPSEGELLPEIDDIPSGYVLKVDLSRKKVSGFLEISYGAALRDIELQGAYFTESALPRETPEEEPDPG